MEYLKVYGATLGPLGVPMTDRQAFAADALLKALPAEDRVLRKAVLPAAVSEFLPGERADVSWITTEAIDRDADVLATRGMDDAHFALNPLVALNHCYWVPPVGRSLWRKKTKGGDVPGVKAKTIYPARPKDWPAGREWEPDGAFALVQAGLMAGKSVGFVVKKAHAPSAEEIRRRPELARVKRVVDEWALIEYSCCWLPANPEAVTESVAKSVGPGLAKAVGLPAAPPPLLTLDEVRDRLAQAIGTLDVAALAIKSVQGALAARRGAV